MTQPSFFRLAFKQFWFLFGAIWLFVGSIFVIVGLGIAWNDWRYTHQGATAQGTVVEKYTRSGSKGSTNYYVDYEFTTADGIHISGSGKIDRDVWQQLQRGGRVTVQYLPEKPDSNRAEGGADRWLAIFFPAFGGIFAGVGGFLFFKGLSRARTVLRLLGEGVRVEGSVAAVEPTKVSINRVPQWVVKYSYYDFAGQVHEAKSDYMSPSDAERWNVGDKGSVRYDQNRPDVSYWVGREES